MLAPELNQDFCIYYKLEKGHDEYINDFSARESTAWELNVLYIKVHIATHDMRL